MRVTVTNISAGPRGFHNSRGRVVILAPGETVTADIDHGTEYMISKTGDYSVSYSDDPISDLIDRAGDMSAIDFRRAAGELLGDEFPSKRTALEALENANSH